MRKIIFVWNFPNLAGVPLNQMIFKGRYKKYCKTLNEYFVKQDMDFTVEMDTTFGDLDKLIKEEYDVFMFISGGQTKFFMYKEQLEKSKSLVYYLSETELYNSDISKFIKWLNDR